MPKLPTTWTVIGAVLVVIGLYQYGHHAGWAERDAEMQSAIAQKNEEARLREEQLTGELNQTSIQLKDANDAITEKQSALDRAIRSGRVRLPAPSCVQANASPAPASGSGDQARSQPDRQVYADPGPDDSERQTLAAIAAIIAQGDRNTEQLNACIDAYNKVMEQVNGQR